MVTQTYQDKQNESKTKKCFVPKVRAPHLMQKEAMALYGQTKKKNVPEKNVDADLKSNTEATSSNEAAKKVKEDLSSKQKLSKPLSREIKTRFGQNESINYHDLVSKLYGVQRKIIHFLVRRCVEYDSVETGPLTSASLSEACQTSYKTIKKIMQRLIEKGLFTRTPGKSKRGKGGFSTFTLSSDLINIVKMQISIENNHFSLLSPNKSSDPSKKILPEEWKNINFDLIKHIGFGEGQINQLFNTDVSSPKIIQASINQFAYTLEHKSHTLDKYGSPIAALMATLNKGGYWTEPDYISPQELAVQKVIEREEKERDRIKKLHDKLFELEYEKWKESQKKDFLQSLVDPKTKLEGVKIAAWRIYFRDHVWNEIKAKKLKQ